MWQMPEESQRAECQKDYDYNKENEKEKAAFLFGVFLLPCELHDNTIMFTI